MKEKVIASAAESPIEIQFSEKDCSFCWSDVFKYAPLSRYFRNDDFYNPLVLFSYANGFIPNYHEFKNINGEKLIALLQSKFRLTNRSTIYSKKFESRSGKSKYTEWIGIIQKDIWVYYSQRFSLCEIYFGVESHREALEEIFCISKSSREKSRKKNYLNLIAQEADSLSLKEFKIPKVKIDLSTLYNDDFGKVHCEIIRRLKRKNDKGIVLLHGESGTGKTSYLRYLAQALRKPVIYIPADLVENIAAPDFVGFLSKYSNSILIIEDAENIVSKRTGVGRNVVSNLLNMSDGLLGDCLSIQIICTFNCPISRIDEALLRKGRLIAEYEFQKLSLAKSQQLIDKLGFDGSAKNEMTLAEIFNLNQNNFHEEKKRIGF